jgi:hypothetical protein
MRLEIKQEFLDTIVSNPHTHKETILRFLQPELYNLFYIYHPQYFKIVDETIIKKDIKPEDND